MFFGNICKTVDTYFVLSAILEQKRETDAVPSFKL